MLNFIYYYVKSKFFKIYSLESIIFEKFHVNLIGNFLKMTMVNYVGDGSLN